MFHHMGLLNAMWHFILFTCLPDCFSIFGCYCVYIFLSLLFFVVLGIELALTTELHPQPLAATASHYVAQVVLTWRSFCLRLPRAGIIGLADHHAQYMFIISNRNSINIKQ
jgi:hypothetical protein